MKVAFITRVENKKDYEKSELKILTRAVRNARINDIYILSKNKPTTDKVDSIRVKTLPHKNPISPTSFNRFFKEIDNQSYKAFFVCSKEVSISKKDITELITQLEANPKLLVVGYCFKTKNKFLNNIIQKNYSDKNNLAYRVPWNTCCIWNLNLFKKYIVNFDEITNAEIKCNLEITYKGNVLKTEYKGMEDGLAIAKAASMYSIKFKLLDKKLNWKTNDEKKLLRKDIVLRTFMTIRGYSVKDLLSAEIK